MAFFIAFISPGGGELIVIMLVLILLFGANASRILRTIHKTLDKMQRAAADFRYKSCTVIFIRTQQMM